MKFGPQTTMIEALIERAKRLTPEQIESLFAARNDARNVAWSAARDAAWDATWNAARDAAWDAALDAVQNASRDVMWDAAWDAVWDASRDVMWGAAWDAVWDAILALIARDLINESDFNTLYDPWANVMNPRN